MKFPKELFYFIAPIVRIEKVRTSISSANSSLRYRLASHDTMTTITEYELPVDHPWEFPRHQLVLDKVIGEGAFGKVSKFHSLYLFRGIKPPNNQYCFPQFFPRLFLSLTSWKRKQTFYWSKTDFSSVLDQWKVCFLFQLFKQPILFPPIFSRNFSQFDYILEKWNKLFIGPIHIFPQFWTNEKFVFFFNCSNWEKFVGKIGENKIGCLVVWCHEQYVAKYFHEN